MISILDQLKPITNPSAQGLGMDRRTPRTVRQGIIDELRQRPGQTSREMADRTGMDRHSISAEITKMMRVGMIVREIDDEQKFRYRLSAGPNDRGKAEFPLLSDKILEKMSDWREWDTPSLRAALGFPPTRSISTALQKMLEAKKIKMVRFVKGEKGAPRNVYVRIKE